MLGGTKHRRPSLAILEDNKPKFSYRQQTPEACHCLEPSLGPPAGWELLIKYVDCSILDVDLEVHCN